MNWRKLLLSPQGRIGRKSFWIWIAVSYSAAIVAGTFDMTIFGRESEMNPLTTVYSLAALYPSICVNMKRLHDTNHSGWWMLMPFALIMFSVVVILPMFPKGDDFTILHVVALIAGGLIIFGAAITLFVWLGFRKGQPGANKYGEPNSGDREVAPVVEVFS